MVTLQENELQFNANGASLKTNKKNLNTWKYNIKYYFLSLDFR